MKLTKSVKMSGILVALTMGGAVISCTKSGNPVEHTGIAGAFAKLIGGDSSQPKVQYVPDMADAPTLKPQENFLEPPEGSVATNAILYPSSVEDAEKNLKNPLPADPQILELGQRTYDTFCIPCHGASAKGDGSITDIYPRPPDITAEAYQKRGDGFFFYRITFGGNIMPAYGHATMPNERWAVVHYLRKLQGVSK
jgi:mono/diheme cytochrome c family protein